VTSVARSPAEPSPSVAGSYRLLAGAAVGVLALDQVTKTLASDTLRGRGIAVLGGAVDLVYTRNTGAAFSLLPGGGLSFAIIAVLVSAGIVLYYRHIVSEPLFFRLALALILGGAVGNLIDRIRLGYVVDFIDLRWWPVFNIADSAVVVGVAGLIIRSLVAGVRDA